MAKVLIGNFKGPKGDKGDKGDPGTAATIQVGTTQTVQPEENAEVTNSGTTSAAVLNFKIPRGEDGMTDLTAEYKDDSSYTCQPTVNAPVVVKEVDGKAEQVETTGAQLFDASKIATKTQGGATVTNNGDGSFTISGSGNLSESFALFYNLTTEETIRIFKKGTVYNKKDIDIYPSFVLVIINETGGVIASIPPGENKDISEYLIEGNYARFQFYGSSGETIVPGTIKPMLYQDGDGTWEPYTGGSPAPSPDYPQVIKGVGGMGYFDGEWRKGVYQSANGAWQAVGNGICSQNPIKAKVGDNVTLKYPDEATLVILAYKSDGTYLGNNAAQNANEVSYTLPTDTAYVHIDVQMAQGVSITPSTAKYCSVTINGKYQTGVEVTGKNLLNIEEWLESKGAEYTKNGNEYTIVPSYAMFTQPLILFDEPQQITLSAEKFENITSTNVRFDLLNGTELVGSLHYTDKQITAIADSIRLDYGTSGNFKVKGLMLNTGSEPLPYQPYHHTALTIPLTSPLYEGDKICYVKPGESYVDADGDTVVVDRILYGCYRENGKVVFDGSEDENWTLEINNRYYIILNNSNNMYTENTAKCNFFKYNTNVYNDHGNEIGFIVLTDVFYCRFGSASEINSVSNLKAWLSNNPLTVVYRLAQPYFEPFTDQSIFYDLRTDDTLTYIYSSDPIEPNVTVEVAKNSTGGYLLESYAQAQKNAISEASNASRLSAVETEIVALNSMRQELESVVLVTMN